MRLVQFGDGRESWVLPVERSAKIRFYAKRALEVAKGLIIQNASYDLQIADHVFNLPLKDTFRKTTDTAILSRLVDSRDTSEGGTGHSLEALTAAYVDRHAAVDIKASITRMARELRVTKSEVWKQVPLDHEGYLLYAGMDPILTWHLERQIRGRVPDTARPLIRYEHELARICSEISKTGFLLDVEYTKASIARLLEEEEYWLSVIEAEAGTKINHNSTSQVAEVLMDMGHTEFQRTPTGKPKVDDKLLSELASRGNRFAEAVKEAKRARKRRRTWFEAFLTNADANHRCHASINTMQARTARMSITGIPAQTLPGESMVRRCFLAEEGHLITSVDYTTMELRVLAALSGDPTMRQAFAAGEDLHWKTARAAFGANATERHRTIAKSVNFGRVYGGGKNAIAQQTGIDLATAEQVIKGFDAAYPGVTQYAAQLHQEARRQGYITTMTGRRLYVDKGRAYSALNYMIQSSSRDVLGRALIRMDQHGLTPYLRLPIHDEVVASLPAEHAEQGARLIAELMKDEINGVLIPADPEVGGRSWGSLYETKD